ncbi:MAG: ABC transporter ATP-binding protein [Spirochaetales bacterium]
MTEEPGTRYSPDTAVPPTARTILSTHNVAVSPAPRKPILLHGVNINLKAGRLHGLAGPNGSGKTTLLSALAGFRSPAVGEIRIESDLVGRLHPSERAKRIAVVLTERQDPAFLRVGELVSLGRLPYRGEQRSGEDDRRICEQALDRLGLRALRNRRVATLSDGERQRALIARAVAQSPDVLLLDEPTAHLDVAGEVEIISYLLAIARENRIAVLASTHKLHLMLSWCDTLSLVHRDGTVRTGVPEALALSGDVARTFNTEIVRFNEHDLRFNACRVREAWQEVSVRAEGSEGLWTRRALERIGFIDRERASLVVQVDGFPDSPRWLVYRRGGSLSPPPAEFRSLDDLVEYLSTLDAR